VSSLYNKVVTIELYKNKNNDTNIRICGTYNDYGSNELSEHHTDILIGVITVPIYKRKNVSINFSKEFQIMKNKKRTNNLSVSSDFDMEIPLVPPPPSSINYFEIYKLEKGKLEIMEKKYDVWSNMTDKGCDLLKSIIKTKKNCPKITFRTISPVSSLRWSR
jgi:hypothetical protein